MQIHDCEQGTQEWFDLRAGIPTASEFKKLVTSKGEPSKSMQDYAIILAAEKYAGKPLESFSGNSWTDRGKELEPEAKALYEFMRSCEVQSVGFVTDDKKTHGCSPDGLVEDAGIVEFKCLKTENHVKVLMYYQKHQKSPSDYIAQTQGQIFICEREWCDLMFFHPDLPAVIIRQTIDKKFISALPRQIEIVSSERDRIYQQLKDY